MLVAGGAADLVEVLDDVLDVGDEHPLALGAAVAEVVGRVDDGAVAGEAVEHVGVAPGVLAVAVRDQHHAARRALGVATADDDTAVRAAELQVGLGPDHAEVSSRRLGWAVVTPRTVRTTRSGSSHIGTWPTRGRRTNSAPGRRARSVSP